MIARVAIHQFRFCVQLYDNWFDARINWTIANKWIDSCNKSIYHQNDNFDACINTMELNLELGINGTAR
jgi:hypothetical protein